MGELLTYEGFIEKARASWVGAPWEIRYTRNQELRDLAEREEVFAVAWRTGGVTGGNCWSEGGHYGLDPDPEPEMERLMNVLEDIGVSLREGRQLLELVKRCEGGESGYYGNYTDYGFKYVSYDALYDKLVELGRAEPRPDAEPRI